MKRGLLLCVVAALSFGAACTRGPDATTAALQVEGRAEVGKAGDRWRPFTGNRRLGIGDQLRVLEGSAVLSFSGDRQVELRPGSQVHLALGPPGELRPVLESGDLLADVPEGTLTVSTVDTVTHINDGAARISRGSSVLVGSYTALTEIESAGRHIEVPALRQAAVPAAGLVPLDPSPLAYLPTDPWDQRFLAGAAELADQLVARSLGFTAQLRQGEGTDPGFYRQLFPKLGQEPAFDASMISPGRPPGEHLVGLAITLAGTRGTFVERWQDVTTFHDQGADWGLVALDQRVPREPILNEVDGAIGRGPSLLAEEPPPATQVSTPPATPASPRTPSSPGSQVAAPAPSAPAPSAAQPQPSPPSNTGPVRTGIDLVDQTANSVVDLLSGLLTTVGQ